MPALEGLVAIELTETIGGRYCGRLLAEMGATVVRVSSPSSLDADAVWLDPGKQSVALDLDAADGRSLLGRLIERADVLIEDVQATSLAVRGIDEELLARLPQLVHCSISPFGLSGPWAGRPATDIIVSALAGMCAINGYTDGMPLREPGPQAEMVGALVAFIGILAALEDREVSGAGQRVETSTLESLLNVLAPTVLQQSYQGHGPPRGVRGGGYLFPCADGWMSLIISANKAWETIVEVLEVPIPEGDTRFATEASRRRHGKEVRELLTPILRSKTRADLFHLLAPMRVVCGMVMEPAELLDDEHLLARRAFVTVDGGATSVRIPRVAIRTLGEDRPERIELHEPGADTRAWFASEVAR